MNQVPFRRLLRPESRNFVFTIGLILLVGVGLVGGVPVIQLIWDQNKELSDKKAEIEKLRIKKDQLATLALTNATPGVTIGVKENAQIATRALPEKPQVLAVVNSIRTLAQQNSLEIATIRSGADSKQKTKDSQNTIVIFTELSGPVTTLANFVLQLKDKFPATYIESGKLDNESGFVKLAINIRLLNKSFPSELQVSSQPLPELTKKEVELLAKLQEIANREPVPVSSSPLNNAPIDTLDSGRSNPFAF